MRVTEPYTGREGQCGIAFGICDPNTDEDCIQCEPKSLVFLTKIILHATIYPRGNCFCATHGFGIFFFVI